MVTIIIIIHFIVIIVNIIFYIFISNCYKKEKNM